MVQIHFSLIKKIQIGRQEHLLIPHPLSPITSNFYLTLPTPSPLKVDVICILPLKGCRSLNVGVCYEFQVFVFEVCFCLKLKVKVMLLKLL